MAEQVSTQAMSTHGGALQFGKFSAKDYKPMNSVSVKVFSDVEREELKQIMREVMLEFTHPPGYINCDVIERPRDDWHHGGDTDYMYYHSA